MLDRIKRFFGIGSSKNVKGLTYSDIDTNTDMTAYYFESFDSWVSMDEPLSFIIEDGDIIASVPLNQLLIKVREGQIKIKWWEIELLVNNHKQLVDMYWGNLLIKK